MSKMIKILLLIILIIVIVALSFAMVFFMKNDFRNVKMDLVDSYEADVNSIEKIDLNLYSTDVEIKENSEDKILVEYYSNTDTDVKIEEKDSNIIVDEEKSNSNNFFNFTRKKVVLYVPETYTGEYEVDVKSGDVNSEIDLSNNIVNINAKSGDLKLNIVGSLKATTSSGDITINEVKNMVDIDVSSGDIKIEKLNIDENSNITASSGDIKIKENKSDCYVDAKANSGDINIKNNNRKSDIVLTIKTSSGDITVD